MKLLIHFQTSTVAPLKFGMGQVISSHTLRVMWLFIHAGLRMIHVSKRGPRELVLVDIRLKDQAKTVCLVKDGPANSTVG